MASNLQIKRRINGAAGSPGAAGALEGELALNFPGAAGTTTKPELHAFDGSGWRRVNPDVTISTQSINLGTGANIGAAYTTWSGTPANKITGNVVIATFGAPAQAYVLTNPAAPGTTASWTSLGGAVAFATAAQIHAGTDTHGALNSAILRGEALNAPSTGNAAAADADRLVRLNAAGQINSKFLPAAASNVRGAVDPTAAFAQVNPPYASGDIVFANKAGQVAATWKGAAGEAVKSGDALLFDGTNWHHVPNATDLNAYLALAGGTMADGAAVTFDTTTAAGTAGGAASLAIINGAGGTVDNVVIDGGTF